MNSKEVVICKVKKAMTEQLCSEFVPGIAWMIEQSRDLAMLAWGQAGGGRQGQKVVAILTKQISAGTNLLELLRKKRLKKT